MATWLSITLLLLLTVTTGAAAGPEDDVRHVMERFVAAQNAHDLNAVSQLLWDSPQFLWITRGTAIWGRQPALERFETLYRGTWRLEPVMTELRVTLLGETAASIYVPILFTIGPPAQEAQQTRFLMNLVLQRTADGWKTASILPIPAAGR